jgi:hypothetical protein
MDTTVTSSSARNRRTPRAFRDECHSRARTVPCATPRQSSGVDPHDRRNDFLVPSRESRRLSVAGKEDGGRAVGQIVHDLNDSCSRSGRGGLEPDGQRQLPVLQLNTAVRRGRTGRRNGREVGFRANDTHDCNGRDDELDTLGYRQDYRLLRAN